MRRRFLIPPQAIELAPNYRVNLLGTVPVLTLWQRPLRDLNHVIKRTEDLVFSLSAIVPPVANPAARRFARSIE